jgi:hypothetical protein
MALRYQLRDARFAVNTVPATKRARTMDSITSEAAHFLSAVDAGAGLHDA